jgi:hypothetical protein
MSTYMKLVVVKTMASAISTDIPPHIQNHSKRRAANDYSVAEASLKPAPGQRPRRPSPDRLYAKRLGLGLLALLVPWEGLPLLFTGPPVVTSMSTRPLNPVTGVWTSIPCIRVSLSSKVSGPTPTAGMLTISPSRDRLAHCV